MSYELETIKKDSYSAILRFMTKGDITLSTKDDLILSRWIYCDVLLRTKKHTEEYIIDKVVAHFNVSSYTARNDIYTAQSLFAKVRLIQKKYLIHLHLERIDKDIEELRRILFKKRIDKKGKEEDPLIDAKEMMALAKLEEVYTYTLNSVPEEINNIPLPPPIFQFMLPPGVVIERPMDGKTALQSANEILMTEKDGVYTADDKSK